MAIALRALLICLSGFGVFLVASATPPDPDPDFTDAVWISDSNGLVKVDAGTGNPLARIPLPNSRAVAIDERSGVAWVFSEDKLFAYDFAGQPIVQVALPAAGVTTNPRLAEPSHVRCLEEANGSQQPTDPLVPTVHLEVDQADGAVWIARDNQLTKVTAAGAVAFTKAVASPIVALSFDPSRQRMWAAECATFSAYAADGTAVAAQSYTARAFSTDPLRAAIRDIAYDETNDVVWLAVSSTIAKRNADTGAGISSQEMSGDASFIEPDGKGNIWWGGLTRLYKSTPDYQQLFVAADALPLGEAGSDVITEMSSNKRDGSIWLGGYLSFGRYTTTGERTHLIQLSAIDSEPGAHVVGFRAYADRIAPQLEIVAPAAGSSLATSTPEFSLSFEDIGVGVDPSTLAFEVDGVASTFSCTNTSSTATCTPDTSLNDGSRSISAKVADLVGNVSAAATRTVLIDTTPPVITIAQPNDGYSTNQAPITITGSLSESSTLTINGATVAVDGFNGFSYSTTLAEGANVFTFVATDAVGNAGNASLTVHRDTALPIITVTQPADASYTNQAALTIVGSISKPASLTINGVAVAVVAGNAFSHGVTLAEGFNTFALVAVDPLGNSANASLTVYLDTAVPAAPTSALIEASASAAGQVTVTGAAGTVEGGATVRIRNGRTGQVITVVAATDGSFTASFAGLIGDELEITQIDGATNESASITRTALPPNPSNVAPALSEEEFTPMLEAVSFLYEGPNPIQVGVQAGALDPYRVAVLKGRVLNRADQPLRGVRITVKDQPQLGYTVSREDGAFDMVVNGGGSVFLDYVLEGHLPVQRQVQTPLRSYGSVDDVVMTMLDTVVTTVALGASSPVQIASGSVVTDDAGTRQATAMFPSNLTATMTLPDGSSVALSAVDIRATEYTTGANGPEAMPGVLPPTSGYTYAVELSVDQALAAGAKDVQFSKPVPIYVDNFLEFPVGQDVPAGYYDRAKGTWMPSLDGRIIKVLPEDPVAGAVLDVIGNNEPATAVQLSDLGITSEERIAIAGKYEPGESFWRIPVTHFTPWDFNLPVGPPAGAIGPPEAKPEGAEAPDSQHSCTEQGCVIEPTSQSLGEDLSLVGVPYSMHYRSMRTPGGRTNARVTIPVTGPTVPLILQEAVVEVNIAGQIHRKVFTSPGTNLKYVFEWDGRDGYGRPLLGEYRANITVAFVYPAIYYSSASGFSSSFAAAGSGLSFGYDRPNRKIRIQRKFSRYMTGLHPSADLGGWSLNVHHFYDPESQTLHRGDGERVTATNSGLVIKTIAGNGTINAWDIPATSSSIAPYGPMAVSAAGDVYFTQNNVAPTTVFRVDSAGYLRRVASGLDFRIDDMDFGPDGALYMLAKTQSGLGPHIRKMDVTTGAVSFYAGGISGSSYSIDVAEDGSVYIVDPYCSDGFPFQQIRRITPSGENTVHFKLHTPYCQTAFNTAAVGPDGTVYIGYAAGRRGVSRFTPQGQHLDFLPGSDVPGLGDGGPASQAGGDWVVNIMTGSDGTVYIMEHTGRIRAVTPDGVINTIAGGGTLTVQVAEGAPARAAKLGTSHFALGPDGALYENAGFWLHLRKIANVFEAYSPSTFNFASRDGREFYSFTRTGRHLSTRDAFTGKTLYSFAYNAKGEIASVTDVDGDVTTVERDGAGKPSAIVGPDGHSTTLTTDANGYLGSVTSPAGEAYQMTYDAEGLLKTFKDPRLQTANYGYDPATGGLSTDDNAFGGGWTLGVTRNGQATTTTMTSAEGRTSTFLLERLTTNDLKQVRTRPDGTVSTVTNRTDGVTTSTAPDGTTSEVKELPDPRFRAQAPVTTSTLKTPSGITGVSTVTRTATLSDKYNPLSLTAWSQTTSLNGKNFVSSYAPTTRTWTSASPLNRQSVTTLDTNGRPATSRYATFETTGYTYLADGRLDAMTTGTAGSARVTDFSYYTSGYRKGWLQSVTDAENRTVSYDYDLAGRVTTQTLPDSRVIGYSYDANGNLTSLTPPGRDAHEFHYNAGDLEDEYKPPTATDIGTRVTEYQYSLDKNLELITRPDGQTIDFVYNTLPGKKLSSIVIPTGTYDYTYLGGTGQLDTLTAPGGQSLDYGYDGFLVTSEASSGVVVGTVSWGYNNDFRVNSQTAAGSAISFGYDNDGLLTSIGPSGCAGATCLSLTRNATHGLITSTAFLTNTTTTHTYNTFGEPATDQAKYGATTLYSASYPVRDKLGRIKQKVETVQGVAATYDYAYDTAGRLDTVTKNGALVSDYGYDTNGNRTAVNGTTVATYDGQDRLLSYNGKSYTYTANGELLTKTEGADTTTYGYDVLGNLRTVELPDGTDIEYVIDGRNRRVGKKVNGALVQGFLYGNQLEPVAELDGSGNLVARFVYGSKPHVPDYMVKAGVIYRVVSDHLGSPRLVINTTDGSVAQRMDYDEFGVITNDTSPAFQPFGFAGGIYDQQTKLTRFGARDYDAETGRWAAKDPAGLAGGLGLYSYAANNPITFLDVTGFEPVEVIFWDPAGVGRSSLGHVSQRIGDTSYSFAPDGMDIRPFNEYLAKQQNFRNGHGIVLDVSPEASARIEQMLKNYDNGYGYIANNCTAPIQNALGREFGFGYPRTPTAGQRAIFPVPLEQALRNNFKVVETTYYPRN